MLTGVYTKLAKSIQWQNEDFALEDGEIITLSWAGGQLSGESGLSVSFKSTPILVLHHGAFCDYTDLPGQGYVARAITKGWIVCAINRRGHAGRKLTIPKWNFFGSTTDIKDVTKRVILERHPNATLFMLGLSSGSGLLARYFGEGGCEYSAGVGVCPGYNIEQCMGRMQWPYQDILLSKGTRMLCTVYHSFGVCVVHKNLTKLKQYDTNCKYD